MAILRLVVRALRVHITAWSKPVAAELPPRLELEPELIGLPPSATLRLLWHDKGTNYAGVADNPERRGGPFATARCNGNSCLWRDRVASLPVFHTHLT